jgi:hypothetical protein
VIAEGTRKLLGNQFDLEDFRAPDLKDIVGPVPASTALLEAAFRVLQSRDRAMLLGSNPLELPLAKIAMMSPTASNPSPTDTRIVKSDDFSASRIVGAPAK